MAHVPLLPAGVQADLENRYAEPHRRYHTLAHVHRVLAEVDRLLAALPADAASGVDADAVRLAAWFHDAVYDPRSSINEADSADLAEQTLAGTDQPDGRVATIRRLILATAGHQPAPDRADEAVLLDADLAVLAADPAAYDRYSAAVRAEYGHLDDRAWRDGRAAFLESMLTRDRFFTLADAARETAARSNLNRELDGLRAERGAGGPRSGSA